MPGRVTEMPATAQPKRAAARVLAFGEGYGEAAVECVAGAGGFDDGAGVDGGNVGAGGGVLDECALRAEGDDGVADTEARSASAARSALASVGDADAGEDFGFALVGGDVVAEREDGLPAEWQAGAGLRMVGTPSECASARPCSTVGSASSSWVTKMADCAMSAVGRSTSAGVSSKQAPGTTMMAFSPLLASMRMAAAPVGVVVVKRYVVSMPSLR